MKIENYELIKNIAIDGCLFKKAIDDLQIHPKAIDNNGEVSYTGEYERGWNSAIKEQFVKYMAFNKFIKELKPHQKQSLENLLINDVIELSYNVQVVMWININDIFVPAADSENIYAADLVKINTIYNKFGYDGIIAWIANEREVEPLSYKYKKNYKYKKALKYIKNKLNYSKGAQQKSAGLYIGIYLVSCFVWALLFGLFLGWEIAPIGLVFGAAIYVILFVLIRKFRNG